MSGKKSKIAVAFGKVLRDLRTISGKTQEELALDCGLDRSFISMLERGYRQPTLQTILTLAIQLDVEASYIVESVQKRLKA